MGPSPGNWLAVHTVGINTVDRDLNENKTVVPLFGAIYTNFLVLISPLSQSSISEVEHF